MKKTAASCLMYLSIFLTTQSNAIAFTGNEIHKAFREGKADAIALYVRGVLDGYRFGALDIGLTASTEAIERGQSLNGVALSQRGVDCFKIPDKVDTAQLIDIVKKFLIDHPEVRQESGARLILQAISKSFPCK